MPCWPTWCSWTSWTARIFRSNGNGKNIIIVQLKLIDRFSPECLAVWVKMEDLGPQGRQEMLDLLDHQAHSEREAYLDNRATMDIHCLGQRVRLDHLDSLALLEILDREIFILII